MATPGPSSENRYNRVLFGAGERRVVGGGCDQFEFHDAEPSRRTSAEVVAMFS